MNSRRALISLFVAAGLYGAIAGYYASFNVDPPRPLEFLFTATSVVLLYLLYYFDAAEQKYKHTVLLGGAIVMLSVVAIPYYLVRSRPSGARAKALFRFLGLLVLAVLVIAIVGLPFALFQNGS